MTRFTRTVREKLRDLGWEKTWATGNVDVVKYGEGRYTKQFGKVWITLEVEGGYVARVRSTVYCQTRLVSFAEKLAEDFTKGIAEVKSLNLLPTE